MAAKGGRIDFMFLGPPLPGRWIRYCIDLAKHSNLFAKFSCSHKIKTRMHSSRMHTSHSLTICCSLLPRGGLLGPGGGVSACSGGFSLVWGELLSLLGGGSPWSGGSAWSGGFSLVPGGTGVCLVPGGVLRRPPPC